MSIPISGPSSLSMALEISLLRKQLDVQEIEGEAALELIEQATNVADDSMQTPETFHTVDVYV